jgi:subfamily B ATP-binding cassette protein MsbA
VVADLRLQIHSHLLELPLGFFATHRVGEIVSRVTNDVSVIQGVLVDAPVNLMRQLVTFFGGVILMFYMNWQLTLIILAIIPPLILISTYYGRRLKQLSTRSQDELANATTVLEEMLSGIRVVKSFAREPYERARYDAQIEEALRASLRQTHVRSIFVPVIAFLSFLAMTVLLWVGGRQVINGVITPGELIAFILYMLIVSSPMAEAAGLYGRVQEALGASRRIFDILDAPLEPGLSQQTTTVPVQLNGQVRFTDVSFRYGVNADADVAEAEVAALPVVLRHIDLTAEPGEVIALVGYSGSGKTTLVNLIPRFYDVTQGTIEIDGVDIRQARLSDLRRQIGLVPQETFLFGGTVRENILYGRLDATDDEMQDAARAAYAHDFIMELPENYATVVGERGIRLSAGQRQRIAIARALLKDPRILILDEATSALDTESERWVQAALERLMEGRTSFVIAHRLSTIQRADRILVLSHGEIVERGTHEGLLANGGLYRRLYDMQFEGEEIVGVVGLLAE